MEGDGIPQKGVYSYVQEGRQKKLGLVEEQKYKERKKCFQAHKGLINKKINKLVSVPAVDISHMLKFQSGCVLGLAGRDLRKT